MISLMRGPGGLARRLADDFVPFLIAVAVGGTAIAFLTPLSAGLLAGLAWPVASTLLRAVRRRPGSRKPTQKLHQKAVPRKSIMAAGRASVAA